MGLCYNYQFLKQQLALHKPTNIKEWRYDTLNQTWIFTCELVELELTVDHQQIYSYIEDISNNLPRRKIDPLRNKIRGLIKTYVDEGSLTSFELLVLILQILESITEFEILFISTTQRTPVQRQKWHVEELNDWNSILENPYGLDPSTIVDTAYAYLGRSPQEICDLIPSQWRVIHIESVIRPDLSYRFQRYRRQLFQNCEGESSNSLRNKFPPHSTRLRGRVNASIVRSDILEDMIQPRMTFHGTTLHNVGSIVRHGFKLPGSLITTTSGGKTRQVVSPRSGIAFSDRGIYSSQEPTYALSFARGQRQKTPIGEIPSMRLFVCATLMGRTCTPRTHPAQIHGELVDGYDAHFDGAYEYIVHDEAAILPCYVVHLDFGSEQAKKALQEAQDSPDKFIARNKSSSSSSLHNKLARWNANGDGMSPGDLKREEQRKKSAAMKYFPYGFGTAEGTQFKILEIGSTSDDDEEEYGEWQSDKHGYVRKDEDEVSDEEWSDGDERTRSWWDIEYDEDGNEVDVSVVECHQKKKKRAGHFLDQYQKARMTCGMKGNWKMEKEKENVYIGSEDEGG